MNERSPVRPSNPATNVQPRPPRLRVRRWRAMSSDPKPKRAGPKPRAPSRPLPVVVPLRDIGGDPGGGGRDAGGRSRGPSVARQEPVERDVQGDREGAGNLGADADRLAPLNPGDRGLGRLRGGGKPSLLLAPQVAGEAESGSEGVGGGVVHAADDMLEKHTRQEAEFTKAIGARVRALRNARGVTQGALREELGIDQSRLSRLENGGAWSAAQIFRASAVLHCDPADLVGGAVLSEQERLVVEAMRAGDHRALMKAAVAAMEREK